jgi:tetratricopeptide (TPR) repeat protein
MLNFSHPEGMKTCPCLFLFLLIVLSGCSNRPTTGDGYDEKGTAPSLNAEACNDSARILLESRRINEALSYINKALALDPANPDYFVTLSDIYLGMNNPVKAKDALNKASDLAPLDPVPSYKTGYLYLVLKDYPLAREYFRKAIGLQPVYPQSYFHLGISYLETGDTARAVESLQTAAQQDEGYLDAFVLLGSLFEPKDPGIAAAYYRNAIRIDSANVQLRYNLGMLLQETGNDSLAEDQYLRIMAIDSSFFPASYNLGYLHLVNREDYTGAIRYFDHTLRLNPSYVDALYNRGLCYEILGEKEKARSDYREALRILPNFERAVDGMNRLDQ